MSLKDDVERDISNDLQELATALAHADANLLLAVLRVLHLRLTGAISEGDLRGIHARMVLARDAGDQVPRLSELLPQFH